MDLGLDDVVQSAVQELFDGLSRSLSDGDPRLPLVMLDRPGGAQAWQVQDTGESSPSGSESATSPPKRSTSSSEEHSGALSDDEDGESGATTPRELKLPSRSPSTPKTAEDDAGLSVSPAHAALSSSQRSVTARSGSSSAAASRASDESASKPKRLAAPAASSDEDTASHAAKAAGLLASLQADKSRLKKHLRAEDERFEREHHRKPTRADKEHLRPMYERYRVLKREIEELMGATKSTAVKTAAPAAATKQPKPGSLEALRVEKRALQVQLRRFEEDFRRSNGRAVQFHSDIRPVESDYRRYKDLKKRIAKLERDKT